MNPNTTAVRPAPGPVDESVVDRYVGTEVLPATGAELVERARHVDHPAEVVRALETLTPTKLYHNAFEIWFDTVHPYRAAPV